MEHLGVGRPKAIRPGLAGRTGVNGRGTGSQPIVAAVASAVLLSACAGHGTKPSGSQPVPRSRAGLSLLGVSVTAPFTARAVWRLPWPYHSTHDLGIGGAPLQATIVMRSRAQWMWVGLPGGPLWWAGTGRRSRAIATTVASVAPVTSMMVMGGIQTGNANSLWVSHGATVRRIPWPVPVPTVPVGASEPLSVGAVSGIVRTPSGAVWVMGGTLVRPAMPATAYLDPGLLAPLFHPILAEVTPSGHLVRRVTLAQLVVGGVSGLTQGADGTLWFGINAGRYEVDPEIYRGPAALVHWSPSTERLAVYPVPDPWGDEALLDQILTRGSTVWASLQYSPDGTDSGRTTFLLRFNTQSHRWSNYPFGDGDVYAWTVTPAGVPVTVVQPYNAERPVLEVGHRTIVRMRPGYWPVSVTALGSRIYLVVSGPHRAELVALAGKS